MRADKALAKKFNQRFSQKQDEIQRIPAVLGDGSGHLYPSNLSGFVYALIGNNFLPVFNNRVTAQYALKVWVGYAPEEPTLFQVLSTRSEAPGADYNISGLGYAPAIRYEWLAAGGGQDPLNVHLRAFTPLKLGMSASGGMNVDLFRGFVYSGTEYLAVARQDIDLTSYIPTDPDQAALVLVTIDNTGTVVKTKGNEVDISALALSDLPALPDDTVFVCGAVRVYEGQTAVREGRANTDFVDLRFYSSRALPAAPVGQYRAMMWESLPGGGWTFLFDDDYPDEPMWEYVDLE